MVKMIVIVCYDLGICLVYLAAVVPNFVVNDRWVGSVANQHIKKIPSKLAKCELSTFYND